VLMCCKHVIAICGTQLRFGISRRKSVRARAARRKAPMMLCADADTL
jgi:hypothetical protein